MYNIYISYFHIGMRDTLSMFYAFRMILSIEYMNIILLLNVNVRVTLIFIIQFAIYFF